MTFCKQCKREDNHYDFPGLVVGNPALCSEGPEYDFKLSSVLPTAVFITSYLKESTAASYYTHSNT
jgi:hypothetical protein